MAKAGRRHVGEVCEVELVAGAGRRKVCEIELEAAARFGRRRRSRGCLRNNRRGGGGAKLGPLSPRSFAWWHGFLTTQEMDPSTVVLLAAGAGAVAYMWSRNSAPSPTPLVPPRPAPVPIPTPDPPLVPVPMTPIEPMTPLVPEPDPSPPPLTPLNFPSIPAVPLVPVPSNPFSGRTPPYPYAQSDWINPSPCKTTLKMQGDFLSWSSKAAGTPGVVPSGAAVQAINETYYNAGTCLTWTG